MLKKILAVAPTAEPVSIADLKIHVAVTHDEDDALLEAALSAARSQVEQHTGQFLMPQEWDVYLSGSGYLFMEPVVDVVSVDAVLEDETTEEATFAYDPILNHLAIDPYDGAVRYKARVQVGYSDVGLIPPPLIAAVKLIASDLYNNREGNVVGTSVVLNPTLDRMLSLQRVNMGV